MSTFFMAWARDNELLRASSSGGVFSIISSYVLSLGGVVVGAYMDQSSYDLFHILIDSKEDLKKIRGSKYYQSNAYDIYSDTIAYLKSGRPVLFSGTACQIAALLALCSNIDKSNLITVDVLCHGVANKKIILAYLESKRKQFKKDIKEFKFRTKDVAWCNGGGTSSCLTFEDGDREIVSNRVDTFFMGFNCDLFLRDSCYRCRFIGTERVSDFTLGDFWGIPQKMVDDEHYASGIGLVLVNTQRASHLWNTDFFKEAIEYEEVDPQIAIPHNSALYTYRIKHKKHDYFFSHLDEKDFDKLVYDCLRKEYLKNHIRNIIGESRVKKIKSVLKRG